MQKPAVPAVTGEPVLLEIAPNGQTYGKGVAARLAILAPLIVVNLFSTSRSSVPAAAWWTIIGVAAVIAVGAVLRMVRRVQLTASSVIVTRVLGGPKPIPRTQVGYGIFARLYQQFATAGPVLILVDRGRKKLLYLSGQLFAESDLFGLARAMGLQNFDVLDDPTTPKLIDERHPRVLSFMERRPWAFACIVVVVIIVVATAALVAAGV